MSAAPALEVKHLTMRFGGLVAVNDLNFNADQRDITAIIGPNGAGKTTVFNCLTGFYRPTVGELTFHGINGPVLLEQKDGFMIPREGLARTFQNIRLFAKMSTLENLIVAQHNPLMTASGFSILGLLGVGAYRAAEREAVDLAKFWLERTGLTAKADWNAGALPYGDQRKLEIARAMCTRPRLLCLDEPAAGLNPRETADLSQLLKSIRDEQEVSILLIEHDMGMVMAHLRPHRGARLRPQDRRRGARGDPQRRGGDQGLSGRARGGGAAARGGGRPRPGRGALMLRLEDVHTFYGNIEALKGVSVDVEQGQIVTIIGSNGAGKSTLLMTICGSPKASKGRVVYDGRDITRLATYDIVNLGISQSPEGRRIFPRMTVWENLQMGAVPNQERWFEQDVEKVFTLFPRLKERIGQRGGTLSGGEQQMLAIGRALLARPRMLLLDEPSLGIAPILVQQIFKAIVEINKTDGLTILLVEQNAYQALKIAHRGYVLATGRILMSGTGRELLANPEIRAAYLEGGH